MVVSSGGGHEAGIQSPRWVPPGIETRDTRSGGFILLSPSGQLGGSGSWTITPSSSFQDPSYLRPAPAVAGGPRGHSVADGTLGFSAALPRPCWSLC